MAELVDATDSKSVELRFMSVRVGLGVPFFRNFMKKVEDKITTNIFDYFLNRPEMYQRK